MKVDDRRLRKELRQAGARASEVDELVTIAARLNLLKPGPDQASGVSRNTRGWARTFRPAALAVSAFALGVITVMSAQSAMPTSWLYPVQELSDAVAVKAHPEYRAAVMMRRARQVNELVAAHAPSRTILSTLGSYKTEAAGYKDTPGANYAAFDYCESNLRQAAAAAPPDVRSAIDDSLDSLNAI